MRYTGWIPTISGNLSFSQIGQTRTKNTFSSLNSVIANGGKRIIGVLAKRNLNDAFWPPVFQRLFGYQTNFCFGMIAHSVDVNGSKLSHLTGYVFLATSSRAAVNVQKYWQANRGRLLENAQPMMVDVETRLRMHSEIALWAHFELARSGEISIEVEGERDQTTEALVQQLFMFIKDSAHHHYHHDPKSDSITRLHPNEDGGDEWKLQTRYQLQRAIVSARRLRSSRKIRQAIGILSYASSFEQGCGCMAMPAAESGSAPLSSRARDGIKYEHTLKSLEVLLDDVNAQSNKSTSMLVAVSAFAISIAAITISILQIDPVRDSIELDGMVYAMTKIVESPVRTISLAFLAFIGLYIYFDEYIYEEATRITGLRAAMKYLVSLGRLGAFAIIALLSVFFVVLGLNMDLILSLTQKISTWLTTSLPSRH